MSFEISVVEYPAKKLIGTKVRTTMQKAQNDCPALWQSFGPKICTQFSNCQGAFGVSVMVNENDFDYWAAVEPSVETVVPEGMDIIEIPAGLYAKCNVPNIEQLGPAFMFLYGPWVQGQSEYSLDMNGLCFELYPNDWQPTDAFEVYAPVKK